jgi:hypothetical protein
VTDAAPVVSLPPAAPGSTAIHHQPPGSALVQGAERVKVEPLPDTQPLRLFERIIDAERDAADTLVSASPEDCPGYPHPATGTSSPPPSTEGH